MREVRILLASIGVLSFLLGCAGEDADGEAQMPASDSATSDNTDASTESDLPSVVAIDILLEPDDVMLSRAQEANDSLRMNYPDGFALDNSHRPHITVLQAYVAADRLPELKAAMTECMSRSTILDEPLTASQYYYLPYGSLGLAGIVIERTEALDQLQADVLQAIQPFAVAGGTAEAFVSNADGTPISEPTIEYVQSFAEAATGENFNPHVTIGIGHTEYLDELMAADFEEFEFGVESLKIYQLGDFGTAQKEL